MRRSGRSLTGQRWRTNPYAAATSFAVSHPRGTLLAVGAAAAGFGLVLLIAVSSAQAFLAVSFQSSNNTTSRLSLVLNRPSTDETALSDEELAIARDAVAGIGSAPVPGGAVGGGPGTNSGEHPTGPVGADELINVYGIRVHRSIAGDIRALLDAASADGVLLSGWGWRDTTTQIRLRRQHCGTSEYAIYRMPSSSCRPPTARPGRSQHERGLAVDFTYNGGSISTRNSPGFRWLNDNAAAYGLKNLASEPWHWSTTGR